MIPILPRDAIGMTHDSRIHARPLADALAAHWEYDAHFCAYEALTVPLLGTDEHVPVRLLHESKGPDRPSIYEMGEPVRMVARIGDLDAPAHEASDAWREDTRRALELAGLPHYETRGGFRTVEVLEVPFEIARPADAEAWSRAYETWADEMALQWGLEFDRSCKDWTRLYRLPNVVRDGKPQRAAIVGDLTPRAIRLDTSPRLQSARKLAAVPPPTELTELDLSDPRIEAGLRAAREAPASISGCGGERALFMARRAIVSALGDLGENLEAVMGCLEEYDQRSSPPWLSGPQADVAKVRLEARRGVAEARTPEARMARRRANGGAVSRFAPAPQGAPLQYAPGTLATSEDWDWTQPPPPIDWICKGLALATSERKVSLIAGDPGAGKGPLASYLGLHIALGRNVFGHATARHNVGLIDCEGLRLSARRIGSHARGLGLSPAELAGKFFARDTSPGDLTAGCVDSWVREWVESRGIKVLIVDSYMSAVSARGADPNSPEYAELARELATLGICVIIVAHSRKMARAERGARPDLGDIAGSFALAGMAATAIGVWQPDPEDKQLSHVGCMRAPEGAFEAFALEWARTPEDTEAAPSWIATATPLHVAREAKAEDTGDHIRTRTANAIVDALRTNKSLTESEIVARAKEAGGATVVKTVRDDLVRAGVLEVERSGAKGVLRLSTNAEATGTRLAVRYVGAVAEVRPDFRVLRVREALVTGPKGTMQLRDLLALNGSAWAAFRPALDGVAHADAAGAWHLDRPDEGLLDLCDRIRGAPPT